MSAPLRPFISVSAPSLSQTLASAGWNNRMCSSRLKVDVQIYCYFCLRTAFASFNSASENISLLHKLLRKYEPFYLTMVLPEEMGFCIMDFVQSHGFNQERFLNEKEKKKLFFPSPPFFLQFIYRLDTYGGKLNVVLCLVNTSSKYNIGSILSCNSHNVRS